MVWWRLPIVASRKRVPLFLSVVLQSAVAVVAGVVVVEWQLLKHSVKVVQPLGFVDPIGQSAVVLYSS